MAVEFSKGFGGVRGSSANELEGELEDEREDELLVDGPVNMSTLKKSSNLEPARKLDDGMGSTIRSLVLMIVGRGTRRMVV